MFSIKDSTRMLFASWWIFITILTSFYTANLTAFLTLSRFTLPINTWDDLYQLQKPFVSPKGGCVEYAVLNVIFNFIKSKFILKKKIKWKINYKLYIVHFKNEGK